MVDLDDSVTNTTYLDISNHYLLNENCLMTFGDFKFQSNGKVLSSEILSNSTIDNVLFEGSGFGCPPLRTFKVGPAKLVPENIFKDSQNQWHKYCTDVCLTAGILAQCYGNQVYKINKTHYLYNDTRIESTQNKNKGKKHATTQEIFKKIASSYKTGGIKKYKDVLMEAMPYIGIVMCTWKRISKLDETLKMLSKQTYKNFKFHIWNNNIHEKDQVTKIIEKYSNLQIEVYHSSENIGGIGRFHYATKIADKYSKILFFDDDQIFNNEFIEDFDKLYKPKSVISWFGWKMNGSYYNRSRVIDLKECNYCGTGGMLVDSKIFLDKRILNIPKEFSFIEDLWLSYFAKYEHFYRLYGCSIDLKIIEDGNDQYKNLKPLKEKFYSYLETIYKGKRTFKSDLNKVFNRLENNIPFSLNRFGDGEMMIIENTPIDLSTKHNGEHKYNPKDPKYAVLRSEMIEAIK
jgi:glycosyltransferase involved in cell wall biosynthesis